MKPPADDPDFLDLIAVWHENRECTDERRTQLLTRLSEDSDLRQALAAEVQLAALTDLVQRGESSWLRLEETLASAGASEDESHLTQGGRALAEQSSSRQEEAIMARIHQRKAPSGTSRTPSSFDPLWTWTFAAAALLILGLGVFFLELVPRSGSPSGPGEGAVARLIRLDGDAHSPDGSAHTVGGVLQAGERLTMNRGLVELAFFETGVHVLASAPFSLTAESREHLFVHDGDVKLHVPPQGVGFVVETLERKITDLGTSFVVSTGEEGSKVLVLDGQIAIDDRQGGEESLMFEGDLADFDRDGTMKLRSQGPSGVLERRRPSLEPSATSFTGRLLTYAQAPADAGKLADAIGKQILPLVRAGFSESHSLAPLQEQGPLRFAGIAGTYDRYPLAAKAPDFSSRGGWLMWYSGSLEAPEPGRYRFWGYADNHLLVSVNGKPVFEGSRYDSELNEAFEGVRQNHPSLPCLNAAAGFASGTWVEVGEDPVQVDILFGERSGRLTSGLLLIEREGENYEETNWGQPRWPLFLTEALTDEEATELESLRLHMEDKLRGSFSIDGTAIWHRVDTP